MGPWKLGFPQEKNMGREGQTIAEYALVLVFVALACVAAATLLGTTVQGFYNGFNGSF
jgi:Flp pilus assembly pilin Flp